MNFGIDNLARLFGESSLRGAIANSYFRLRFGIAVLGMVLPFLLWLGGRLFAGVELQDSLSAYYHAHDGAMRDWFVGVLWAVGTFLVLYKGFTLFEDLALTLAGVAAISVALVPMEWDCGDSCGRTFDLHGVAAVSFFVLVIYVALFRAGDTLTLISDDSERKRWRRIYQAMAGVMLVLIAAVFVITTASGSNWATFAVESIAVITFGAYWLVKSRELSKTHADDMRRDRRLVREPYTRGSIVQPVRFRTLDQVGTRPEALATEEAAPRGPAVTGNWVTVD